MGIKRRTMRWYCLLVVLLVVGLASSERSADEVHTLGPEYYGDMSVTTDNDGEDKAGRFGDYSDWIKKYHIGAHHPYHAKVLGEHKVQQHKASGAAPADAAKPASATTAKAAVETPKASRSTVTSSTHRKATSHSKNTESRHTEHASKHDETAVAPDPADALEAELAKLEHSSAADDATDATPAKAAVDSQSSSTKESDGAAATGTAEATESDKSVQPKKSDNHNLKESSENHISLDSLESTLKELESKPVTVLLQTSREGFAENGANDDFVAVSDEVPIGDSAASDTVSDTMGAVYTIKEDQMSMTNFPTQHVAAAKRSSQLKSVKPKRSSQAKSVGGATAVREAKASDTPTKPQNRLNVKHQTNKAKKKLVHKSNLETGVSAIQAKVDAGLDELDAQKAKISAMIDAQARKDLVRKSRDQFNNAKDDSRTFESQLDDLEQTAALDEDDLASQSVET